MFYSGLFEALLRWQDLKGFRLFNARWVVKLSVPKGRVQLEFYPAKHHERFKDWKVGQAWLVRTPKGTFLNVVFSKEVEVSEPKVFVGVDLNENNVTLSLPNGEFVQIITHEREIRTGYFLKRRRIQKKIRAGKRRGGSPRKIRVERAEQAERLIS